MRLNIQEIRLWKAEILVRLIETTDLNDEAINNITSYVFRLCEVPENEIEINSPTPEFEDNIEYSEPAIDSERS